MVLGVCSAGAYHFWPSFPCVGYEQDQPNMSLHPASVWSFATTPSSCPSAIPLPFLGLYCLRSLCYCPRPTQSNLSAPLFHFR